MNIEKKDRRITRTRQALKNALIALILEKHYDEITVQQIIDRADVGRSTFYVHFRDKEDLLIGDWEHFLDAFVFHIKWENAGKDRFVPIRELFFHVRDFHAFYRAMVKSNKMDRLFNTGLRYLSDSIEKALEEISISEQSSPVPVPILANHLAATIFQQLKWWLDNNMPYSPEQMDKIFHRLVSQNFEFLPAGTHNPAAGVFDLQDRPISNFADLHR